MTGVKPRLCCKCLRLLWLVGIFISSSMPSKEGQSWEVHVPPPPPESEWSESGYGRFDFQTAFEEARLGSYAVVNKQTSIGLPGTVPIAFSNLMRIRYSETDSRFEMIGDTGMVDPYTLPGFRQFAPGEWLPGCISSWNEGGIHYEVGLIMVPHDPQPFDLIRISLKNESEMEATGKLVFTVDSAETIQAEGDLIADRGKPLYVMNPAVPSEHLKRDSGCLDPRVKPALLTNSAIPMIWPEWKWIYSRIGYYGMPIEYQLKANQGEELKVFLGFMTITSDLYKEMSATVEGEASAKTIEVPIYGSPHPHGVLEFRGKDMDGDGYIQVSVQATSLCPQRALLNLIQAFDIQAEVTAEDVASGTDLPKPRYDINVGRDASTQADFRTAGKDPTLHALRLLYTPTLKPGEEKVYQIHIPAIDRPEPGPHTGYTPFPYDTHETWKNPHQPRHPENTTPFGFDIPTGMNVNEYAVYGPKPREVWEKQLKDARETGWEEGLAKLRDYWESHLNNGTRFLVPEKVVENLLKKQIAMIGYQQVRMEPFDYYISHDGPDFYWTMAYRTANYVTVALDHTGFRDMSSRLINTWLVPRKEIGVGQGEDGSWVMRPRQWDSQGQVLWSILEHYRLTGDREWLSESYEKVKRGAEWIIAMRQQGREMVKDPQNPLYGLLPPGGMEGPGLSEGNAFYLDSWCLKGMKEAAYAAHELGRTEDTEHLDTEVEDYQRAFQRAVGESFIRPTQFVGTIPDTALSKSAASWSQASLVFPTRTLSPHDLLVSGWLRFREKEGGTSGGLMLWPYIGAELGMAYIVRGESDKAIDLFYSYVDNAAETLDWGEEIYLLPSRRPDYPSDVPQMPMTNHGESPHLWASSLYIEWLRHMLLHEEDDALHIAPSSPRKWLAQPDPWGVEEAPTYFGKVTYHLQADQDQVTIRGEVHLDPQHKPNRLYVHIRTPGGRGIESVDLNDQKWDSFYRETVVIPNPADRTVLEVKVSAY